MKKKIRRKVYDTEKKTCKKVSAEKAQILKNLNPKIIQRSKSINVVVENFEKNVLNQPMKFKVKDYEITVLVKNKKPDLYVSCTCNAWVYQGSEYHAKKENYLYGDVKGTGQQPTERDPNNENKICKHIYAVLRDFF